MTDRRTQIITSLESALQHTMELFQSFDRQDLETKVYQDGAHWSVKQVLAHFITIEKSMHWLFRNMLAGGSGSPRNFDIERFNRTQPTRYEGHSLEELLTAFEHTRKETIGIVKEMSEEDLDREGWHVFHGKGSLSRFVRWAYEHTQLHEEDIRTVLQDKTAK